MASSSSLTTFFMRMRLEWNVKWPSSGRRRSRAVKIAGISVSIVVFELGTICPIRIGITDCEYIISIFGTDGPLPLGAALQVTVLEDAKTEPRPPGAVEEPPFYGILILNNGDLVFACCRGALRSEQR